MKNTISTTYKRQRDSELITITYRIVEKMKNNPNFSTTPAPLAAIITLLPELQSLVSNAKGRDIEVVFKKNKKKAELVTLLTELAEFVTLTCNGDGEKLLSSGFHITGKRDSQEEELVISQLEVELGPPGEATTRVKRLKDSRAYMHQYTTEPPTSETKWVSEGSKEAFYTFSGLASTVKYWFRVVAISQNGETVHSPVVTRVIQ
jgi:hypothetical protein